MNAISINFQNFVQIQNSQIVTTSEFVAQAFDKQHKHVLEKIEQISKEIKASFFEPNFRLKAKQVKTGFGYRETKSYELTKDGFMLLVMGFTGKQAMAIKIAYIEAFNAMSEAILDLNSTLSDNLPTKTTADDRTPLRQAVAALVGRKGIDYSTAYGMIHQRFNVGAIEDIPAEQLPEAVAYVHALTLDNALSGEVLDAVRPSEKPQLTDSEIYALSVCAMYLHDSAEFLYPLSRSLRDIGSSFAGRAYSLAHEPQVWLDTAHSALNRLCANLSDPQPTRRALARIRA